MKVKEESEKVGLKLNIQKTKIMASGPITLWQNRWGNSGWLYFLGSKITADGDCIHEIKRHLLTPWKKSYDQHRQHIKKQRHYFANKGPSSQGYGISSGHVWMGELDYKESSVPKNWCFWTVVLEKTLEWTSLVVQMVKYLTINVGDPGSIPGSWRSPEEAMVTHSSTLAWKIPWMEDPGRLQFMGSQRAGHNWVTSLLLSLYSLEEKLWPT